MNKTSLLTFSQYAERRGVSKAAVTKAIKEGRITPELDKSSGKMRINPEVADKQWASNTVGGQKSAAGVNGELPAGETPAEPEKPKGPSYADSRAIREAYSARMARLEYEEKMRSLIPAAKARSDAYRTARITRDAVLSIPDRISHELAAETDPHAVQVLLTKALIDALDQLVRDNAK